MPPLVRRALRRGMNCLALSSCYCYLDPTLLPLLRSAVPREPHPAEDIVRAAEDDPNWAEYAWSAT